MNVLFFVSLFLFCVLVCEGNRQCRRSNSFQIQQQFKKNLILKCRKSQSQVEECAKQDENTLSRALVRRYDVRMENDTTLTDSCCKNAKKCAKYIIRIQKKEEKKRLKNERRKFKERRFSERRNSISKEKRKQPTNAFMNCIVNGSTQGTTITTISSSPANIRTTTIPGIIASKSSTKFNTFAPPGSSTFAKQTKSRNSIVTTSSTRQVSYTPRFESRTSTTMPSFTTVAFSKTYATTPNQQTNNVNIQVSSKSLSSTTIAKNLNKTNITPPGTPKDFDTTWTPNLHSNAVQDTTVSDHRNTNNDVIYTTERSYAQREVSTTKSWSTKTVGENTQLKKNITDSLIKSTARDFKSTTPYIISKTTFQFENPTKIALTTGIPTDVSNVGVDITKFARTIENNFPFTTRSFNLQNTKGVFDRSTFSLENKPSSVFKATTYSIFSTNKIPLQPKNQVVYAE